MLRGHDYQCRCVLELDALTVVVVHVTHLAVVRVRGRAAEIALLEVRRRSQVGEVGAVSVQSCWISRHARRASVVHGKGLVVVRVLARRVGGGAVRVVEFVVVARTEERRKAPSRSERAEGKEARRDIAWPWCCCYCTRGGRAG